MEHRSQKWQENYGKESGAAPLEEQKALPSTNENTGIEAAKSGSQVSQDLISTSAPNIPDDKYASDLPAEEYPPLSHTNKDTGKETEVTGSGSQCSQDMTTEAAKSGSQVSQDLISTSAPNIPDDKYASDLPAEEYPPLSHTNKDTGKETEVTGSGSQCSQDMTTGWVPEMDNIHSSAKEREAGLTFESVYNSLLYPNWSPSLLTPYKNRRRLPEFKKIEDEMKFGSSMPSLPSEKYDGDLPAKENLPLPKINQGTGKETEVIESGSQCSEFLTTSSVLKMLPDTMESNKTEREEIDLSSSQAQNPSNTGAVTSILELKAPEIAKFSKEEKTMKQRSQKKQAKKHAIINKIQLGKEFIKGWKDNYGNESRAAPVVEREALTNTKEITGKEAPESASQVSQELTNSCAPNTPDEKYASDLQAEENPPLPNINKDTGKETEGGSQCSQDLATSSMPEVTGSGSQCSQDMTTSSVLKRLPDRVPQMDCIHPSAKEQEVHIPFGSFYNCSLHQVSSPHLLNPHPSSQGSQELTSSSTPSIQQASVVPAKENLPLPKINQDTGKETEVIESGSQCSEYLTTSSVLKRPPDRVPQMDSIHPSAKEQEVHITFVSFYNCSLHQVCSPHLPNPHRNSQGSQELTSSSAPSIQQASVVPAEENLPLPKINKDTGKETKVRENGRPKVLPETMENNKTEREKIDLSSSQAQNPSNTGAVTSILELKAPEITKFRKEEETMKHRSQKKQAKKQAIINKIQLGKEFIKGWKDNYGNESRAAPVVERKALTNTKENTGKEAPESASQVSQELTNSSAPNTPDEKYASDLQDEENPPLPNINKDTGKETEGGSQCFQDLATSSMPEVTGSGSQCSQDRTTDRVPQMDRIHPSAKEQEVHIPFGSFYNCSLHQVSSPHLLNPHPSSQGSQELTSSSAPSKQQASVVPAKENLPLPKILLNPHPSSQGSQELTSSSAPSIQQASVVPAKENLPLPKILLNPHPSSQGSQELTSFSAPSIQQASVVPAKENLPLPKINQDTGKETEVIESGSQCSEYLTTSSVLKRPPGEQFFL